MLLIFGFKICEIFGQNYIQEYFMIESYISSKFIFLLGDVDKFGFFNKQLLTYEY